MAAVSSPATTTAVTSSVSIRGPAPHAWQSRMSGQSCGPYGTTKKAIEAPMRAAPTRRGTNGSQRGNRTSPLIRKRPYRSESAPGSEADPGSNSDSDAFPPSERRAREDEKDPSAATRTRPPVPDGCRRRRALPLPSLAPPSPPDPRRSLHRVRETPHVIATPGRDLGYGLGAERTGKSSQ